MATMTPTLRRAFERLRSLPAREQDRIGRRLLDETSAEEDAASEDAPPRTLAEAIAPYVGVLDSGEIVPGGARMSQNTGEAFASGMEEKRRQRHP